MSKFDRYIDKSEPITPDEVVDIVHCQRCGNDHVVTFKPLLNATDDWKWWGICPNVGQPVLMRFTET